MDVARPAKPSILLISGRAERSLATLSGYFVVFGWLADAGQSHIAVEVKTSLRSADRVCLLRYERKDVEAVHTYAPKDSGYMVLTRLDGGDAYAGPATLAFSAEGFGCAFDVKPTFISDLRLLEEVLAFFGHFRAHAGREQRLKRFLDDGGRALLAKLNEDQIDDASNIQDVVRFGRKRRGPTFQTVLFGSMDPVMFQPLLFEKAGLPFGEWIYVCNSPQHADELVRYAKVASKLYDLPICVILLSGNAGFGGANNAAISHASDQVVLINPDVQALPKSCALFQEAMRPEAFGTSLRGGLLFYDENVLMHGGMYLDEDISVGCGSDSVSLHLLRVEHFEKGVPFDESEWQQRRSVPAVTGAVMAFGRHHFEQIGGFSRDFIFGHYEDADLCLRWSDTIGRVEVDPNIRLVHLEGQGSKSGLPQFFGASLVNRHIFDARARGRVLRTRPERAHIGLAEPG